MWKSTKLSARHSEPCKRLQHEQHKHLLEAGSSLILRPRPRIARGNHYQSSTVNSDTVMKDSGSPASPWLHESRSTVASTTIWPATTNSASGRHSASLLDPKSTRLNSSH